MLKGFVYKHPEIEHPWRTDAIDKDSARGDFESQWMDATRRGDIAEIQGSFADGSVEEE